MYVMMFYCCTHHCLGCNWIEELKERKERTGLLKERERERETERERENKAIKQATRQYRDKVVSQFNGSDTRGMWQGLQSITDYKKKTSPVADPNILLPDKLNNFFACFEDNTVPPTRPTTKTCGLSFTAANLSKTFKCVNPRRAAGPDGIPSRVFRACADQLAGVFKDIQWGKKVFSQPPIVQVLPLKKMRGQKFSS